MGEGEQKNRLLRFRELFEKLMELPESDHNAFLDENCGEDHDMKRELLGLILQTQSAGRKIDQLGKAAIAEERQTVEKELLGAAEHAGTRIDRYSLIEPIGEGGFGIVWLAEQDEPVKRKVALKIIKLGMDTREVVARFEVERQALAMMDHPNIATVFDAGATDTGRPYFVMELVQGIPITEYCNENHLTLKERLKLFIHVCHAVQHAHQVGVIHRDIKPSNILVSTKDGQPLPKIIDFGIAKATSKQLTDPPFVTQLHAFVGTPFYSSPEQMDTNNQFVDTRTDIYSLGIVLYELLTGHVPFDPETLSQKGLEAMYRLLRENDPPKPSTRLRTLSVEYRNALAKQLGTRTSDLTSIMKGDLDAIVMHSIEWDRTMRYATANGLAEDLEHFLAHEPISARHPSLAYTAGKFLRRHRRMVTSLVAMALILITGTVTSIWQAVRATRAEQQVVVAMTKEVEARKSAEATIFTYNAQEILGNERASTTHALAHVIASLEQEDTRERRLLALLALWKAPSYFQMEASNGDKPYEGAQFSSDGKWLYTGSSGPDILLWPSSGEDPIHLNTGNEEYFPQFSMRLSPSGRFLLVNYQKKDTPLFSGPWKQVLWDMKSLSPYKEWRIEKWAPWWFDPDETKLLAYSLVNSKPFPGVAWWSIDDKTIQSLNSPHADPLSDIRFPPVQLYHYFYSPSEDLEWLVSWHRRDVFVSSIGEHSLGEPVWIGSLEDDILSASINRDGSLISTADERELTIWNRVNPGNPLLKLKTHGSSGEFDIWGSHIIAGEVNSTLWAYDFGGPIGSDPTLFYPLINVASQTTMSPDGKWLVISSSSYKDFARPTCLHNLNYVGTYDVDIGIEDLETFNAQKIFPDLSGALITTSDGRIYHVDLTSPEFPKKVFFESPSRMLLMNHIFDPQKEFVLVGTLKEKAWLVPIDGSPPVQLKEGPTFTDAMAFSPSGNLIALAGGTIEIPVEERYPRILDRQGNRIANLQDFSGQEINHLAFLSESELLISSDSELKHWNFQLGKTRTIKTGPHYDISISKHYVLANGPDTLDLYDRDTLELLDNSLSAPARKSVSFYNFTTIAPNEKFIIGKDQKENWLVQYLNEDRYHLIPSKGGYVGDIRIDPNGYWFAAINYSGIVTYWPIPSGEPLHDRPIDEFLKILKAQTNVRVVLDLKDERGYHYEVGPFPGWETNNSWQEWYSPEYMKNTPWKPMLDLEALGIDSIKSIIP